MEPEPRVPKQPKWFITEITLRSPGRDRGDITYDVRNKVWDAWLRGVGPIGTFAHVSEARHAVEAAIDLSRKKIEARKKRAEAMAAAAAAAAPDPEKDKKRIHLKKAAGEKK